MTTDETFDVAWSLRALKDLQQIRRYYSRKASAQTAQKIISRIVSSTVPLRTHPEKFRKDPYLVHKGRNIRYYVVKPYRITYEFTGWDVVIARVLHEHRNLEKVLSDFD